ncbi:MAG: tRNA (cytidine(34)-2'-O)-methyltransferase [Gammaproteobacteria bacterium]|nr:tRNA (cytidine(34)-2'-O)-methyltransferase [Gammaproteobacteria bacterium]
MFHIVLIEPQIPPNTGNIIRLCANCGAKLHLVQPLGFDLSDRKLKRAGLDYHDMANVKLYDSFTQFISLIKPHRVFACSTKGQQNYSQIRYDAWDALVFGPETRGLSTAFLNSLPATNVIRIPMLTGSRSLNLSNATAIIVYEALRQNGFGVD